MPITSSKQREGIRPKGNSNDSAVREGQDVVVPAQEAEAKEARNPNKNDVKYEKELTVCVEINGDETITTIDQIKAIRWMCGCVDCSLQNDRTNAI